MRMLAAVQDCKTILVVDDEPAIRESLGDLLREEGYEVLEAQNGAEALVRLREPAQHPPCVIILDLMMPVMDGYEFRAEQLRDAALADIPVVVVSADGNVRRKTASMQVAAALAKPLQLNVFVAEIERHCKTAAA